ncbi:ferric reductase [Neofusicoccum parvum]|uniref:Ferric reductase n=1 Tax=Neofusicoccum parvum TaxID=310453 RepID=A0ACB5S9E9_9PEZI|nr:ferric reductase [Neofusicoccum parvum]
MLLTGYGAGNVVLSFLFVDFNGEKALEYLRDRTGVLCVLNMLPLFFLAGRNNPLICLTGISFDTFNLVHRWVGRIAVLHAVAHTVFYLIHEVQDYGWSHVADSISNDSFYTWGTVGLASFILIFIQAWSPIRHAFYEIFLHFHVFLTAVGLAGIWVHCQTKDLYQLFLVQIALGIFKAGQHIYLYMPRVGFYTSHPFSLAWSEGSDQSEKEICLERLDRSGLGKVSMSLLVRCRSGFTETLYQKAHSAPDGKFVTSALVEGPYGSEDLSSYDSVMLIAAGVGIAHHVPQLRALIDAHEQHTSAIRSITLIWIVQSPEHVEWIKPWLTEVISTQEGSSLVNIQIFATRAQAAEICSPPGTLVIPGKPNIEDLINTEVAQRNGACAVSVCGTGSLGDDVRRVIRGHHSTWNVDFFEESFSW